MLHVIDAQTLLDPLHSVNVGKRQLFHNIWQMVPSTKQETEADTFEEFCCWVLLESCFCALHQKNCKKTGCQSLPRLPVQLHTKKISWYDFFIVTTSQQMQSNSLLIAFIDRPLSNPFALVSKKDVCMPQHFSAFFFSLLLNHVFKDSTEGICLVWRKDQSSMFGIPCKDKVTNTEILATTGLPAIYTILKQRRVCWVSHVIRMDYGHIPKTFCTENWKLLCV